MKAPAFQFYPGDDFLTCAPVMALSMEERGIYVTLYCWCWVTGSIPANPDDLARLCAHQSSALATLLERLPGFQISQDNPGRMIHTGLEMKRAQQEENRKKRSEAGRKGGKAKAIHGRKATRKQSSGNATAKPSSSSSSSSSIYIPPNPQGGIEVDPPETLVLMGRWFGRNADEGFSEQERAAFLELDEIRRDDVDALGEYYTAPPPTEGKDFRRQTLKALLKNFRDEVDKARAWKKRNATAPDTEPKFPQW